MFKLSMRSIACLVSVLLASMPTIPALAFDSSLFYNNNIIFYDPDSADCIEEDCIETNGDDVTFIGDSIGVSLKDVLAEKLTKLDTSEKNYNSKVSRKWNEGLEVAKNMQLKDIVIFELGTNSAGLTQADIDNMIDTIGANHTIVLITNYGDNSGVSPESYAGNNELFIENSQKNNIILVDWASAVADHADEWLSDGVHPTSEGNEQLATLIYEALNSCTGNVTSSGGVALGTNTDYAGNQILNEDELAAFERFKPLYQEAAGPLGIPWQFLAALHYRESRMSQTNPSNGQGVFQLYTYVNNTGNTFPAGEISDEEFVEQARLAGEEVITATPELAENPTDDTVKLAFFRYNGAASVYKSQARDLGFSEEEAERGEGSPYVMNKADAQRDPNVNPDGWGQIKIDNGGISYPANQDYGAYVVYIALGGGTGDICITGGNGDIAQLAWDLSWHEGESGFDKLDPKPEYQEAINEVGLSTYGDSWVQIGASCDAFVATVYRLSGVDPDFQCCGTPNQIDYLEDSDQYELIADGSTDTSILESGDVLILDGHIKLYIEHEGEPYEAQASYADHSAQTTKGVSLIDGLDRGTYMVFRHK